MVVSRAGSSRDSLGLFPSGKSQARVRLPALMIQVEADVVQMDGQLVSVISDAVSGGATAVILAEGRMGGANALYEAAVALKSALRGRASLLLVDRTDVAAAAEADGVLLSESGERCMHACLGDRLHACTSACMPTATHV